MKDFEAGMRSIRDSLAEKNPELLEAFEDRPFPKASLLYSLYEKEEIFELQTRLWICGSVDLCVALGSWLLARGSWLLAPGSWLLAPSLNLC